MKHIQLSTFLASIIALALALTASAGEHGIPGKYVITCSEMGNLWSTGDPVGIGGFGEVTFRADNTVEIHQQLVTVQFYDKDAEDGPAPLRDVVPNYTGPVRIPGTYLFDAERFGEGGGQMTLETPMGPAIAHFKPVTKDHDTVQKLFLTIPCTVPVEVDDEGIPTDFATALVRAHATRVPCEPHQR